MTDEELKKARWIDRGVSLLLVIVGVMGTSWAAGITDFKKQLNEKADKIFVTTSIESHEEKELLIIAPLKKNIEKLQESDIHQRQEYQESDRQLRKDFIDQIKMLRIDLNLKQNKD